MGLVRRWLTDAGRSTAGGVPKASSEAMTHMGNKCILDGDSIYCPKCKTTGYVKHVKPDANAWLISVGNGVSKMQCLSDDLCICKCTPPPRMIASDIETEQTACHVHSSEIVGDAVHWYIATGNDPSAIGITHDQRFKLTDENTGEPISGQSYVLECNGHTVEGETDADGMTQAIHAKSGASQVTIFLKA